MCTQPSKEHGRHGARGPIVAPPVETEPRPAPGLVILPAHLMEGHIVQAQKMRSIHTQSSKEHGRHGARGLHVAPPVETEPRPAPGLVILLALLMEGHIVQAQKMRMNGSWSKWGDWSVCTMSLCSVTNRTRSRSCDSPAPTYGGRYCEGDGQDTESCEGQICPTGERLMCAEFPDNKITSSALEEKLTEISKVLKVNKTNLSSQKRKRACAEDPRPTSMYIGYVGVIFIGCFLGIIVFVDCSSFIVWALKKRS
ncbi:semaphorin-5A-like [Saccostrea echinata]|uniref:semaphorin-5A-like n=1 Tax=Saccostrea echinata TaxID=191078 RepID=UPI002A800E63|nr:semaphorin-5A-like [Saccostrea echinata]